MAMGRKLLAESIIEKLEENSRMIIVFDGDTLALEKRLQQFASATEKATLDFMLENFKILQAITVDDEAVIDCLPLSLEKKEPA